MSCNNCYSSRKVDASVIEKVLEQGQKLRDAMMQTIMNEPNSSDLTQNPKSTTYKSDNFSLNERRIRAYLQGDPMCKDDELLALETLRSMSPRDLCRTTEQTYRSNSACKCPTCIDYREDQLICDLKRANQNVVTKRIQESYRSDVLNHLKYIDSLKISISSVNLNEAGLKKVYSGLSNSKTTINQTFFIEYIIPAKLLKPPKSKSKVDSGLHSDNTVRMCARSTHQQVINFKQSFIHDIINLTESDLSNIKLKFNVSFRNFKEKRLVNLGCAIFNFNSFEVSKNFTCLQELVIHLKENVPINVGTLRVALQLGCGHLYFGKEFIDAVKSNRENVVPLESSEWSSSSSEIFELPTQRFIEETTNNKVNKVKKKSSEVASNVKKKEPLYDQVPSIIKSTESPRLYKTVPNTVLFGYVHISEAQFTREVLNSYLTCQLFGQDDYSSSNIVALHSNPVYNFHQQIPLLYGEDLLLKFRENFMVVEFYEQAEPKDFLVGYSKLNLHPFYLAFRNPVIVKYLLEKELPVIAIDEWETIYNKYGEITGHAHILLALGTREQIENLERARGFKQNIVKPRTPRKKERQYKSPISRPRVDIGVQSEMDMSNNKESIEKLLNQLVSQKPRNICVENGTNTETAVAQTSNSVSPKPDLRSTSELLDSLQKALSLDSNHEKDKKTFKVQIAINSALHLPSRKKCKARKSRGKSAKHEDILPSCYVTFEATQGNLKMTQIIPKSVNPKWDYRCEVSLPLEYLTDNQKLLVFKVWRKSTNTIMTPNFQTDVIIGFATVDLTVLAAGLPNIQGWFNINDLSKKCNGQINIHITPLENISELNLNRSESCCEANTTASPSPPIIENNIEEPSELLGRALKRKFTELDEITQRLRLRLSKVTNDESDASNDEIADEFERDINTLCIEEDFDMINFEAEARSFNSNHTKDIGLLQQSNDENGASAVHLDKSKQKIDMLLEKLSLISAENTSRYVSGCSSSHIDTEAILNELDHNSRPNIYADNLFNHDMVLKYGSSLENQCLNESTEAESVSNEEQVNNN